MEFLYRDESQSDGSTRRVLYPNKSNMPKGNGEVHAIEIPTDKPGLMAALQELFDLIPWNQEEKTQPDQQGDEVSTPLVPKDSIVFPSEGTLDTKQQLALRMLLSSNWEHLPITFKADLATLSIEDIRPYLEDLKAKAIGL